MIPYLGIKTKPLQEAVQEEGKVIKSNRFETNRGDYKVAIVYYRGALYFAKYRDYKLVEFVNLDRESKRYREEEK